MMARHLNSLLWLEEMYSDDNDDDHQSKGSFEDGAEEVSCEEASKGAVLNRRDFGIYQNDLQAHGRSKPHGSCWSEEQTFS